MPSPRANLIAVPSGGWHFLLPDGKRIDGTSADDLIAQVVRYRQGKGLAIGNPEDEVHAQICARNPHDCNSGGQAYAAGSSPSLLARVQAWATSFIAPPPLVDAPVAKERAETGCVGCPMNQRLAFGCCGNAVPPDDLVRNVNRIRQGQNVGRYDGELGGCALYGWANQAAVWLRAEMLGDALALVESSPERCWLRGV